MKTQLTTTALLALTLISVPALADDHRPGTPPSHGAPPSGQGYGHDDDDDDDHGRDGYGHDDRGGYGQGYGQNDRGYGQGYAVTGVSLINHSGVEMTVWVDGSFRGPVRANDTRTFSETPGLHQVVARGADGCVLYDSAVMLAPRGLGTVEVVPPFATATLFNNGSTPLYVSAGRTSLWILPGTSQDVRVPNGCSHVITSIVGPRGALVQVGDVELRAVGGQRIFQSIGWTPPPRLSGTTLTNHQPTTVRVTVDNREVLCLRPGETATVDLTGGRHQVMIAEIYGRVLFNAPVDIRPGNRSVVDIWNGVRIESANGTYVASR